MLAYCLGIGFLIACLLGVPLLRKLSHERMLRSLEIAGAALVPRFPALSGLRIARPAWKGLVTFEAARLGGGRPGHLRIVAEFAQPLQPIRHDAPIRTGDAEFDRKIVVEGDPGFARKFLVPEMRERLMQLDSLGGRILAIREESMEIDGPLPADAASLRRFLDLCDGIISSAGSAADA
jgi:hypothetical protein